MYRVGSWYTATGRSRRPSRSGRSGDIWGTESSEFTFLEEFQRRVVEFLVVELLPELVGRAVTMRCQRLDEASTVLKELQPALGSRLRVGPSGPGDALIRGQPSPADARQGWGGRLAAVASMGVLVLRELLDGACGG